MTTRDFYQSIIDNTSLPAETIEKATELLAALDHRNEKRKSSDTKEKIAARERAAQVLEFLTQNEGQFTRDAIAEKLSISPAQVTAACRALGERVTKSEIKVDKAKRIAYSIA